MHCIIVSPYSWSQPHPVNDHVAELARGLKQLNPDANIAVLAPSTNARALAATRRAIHDLAKGVPAGDVLQRAPLQASDGYGDTIPVLCVAVAVGRSITLGLRSDLRVLFTALTPDIVHIQDPLASPLGRAAIRAWDGVTSATFHSDDRGTLEAIATPLWQRLLERIDTVVVPDDALRTTISELTERSDQRIAVCATLAAPPGDTHRIVGSGAVVIGRGAGDEIALRTILQSLGAADDVDDVTLLSRWHKNHRPAVPKSLRGRAHALFAQTRSEATSALAGARLYISTPFTHPRARDEAKALGVPVVTVADVTGEFDLAAARDGATTADASSLMPRDLAGQHADLWSGQLGKRHVSIPGPAHRERTCMIDLHMHTNHSWDCATDPEALLFAAREVGLTAIAVTDHNEVSGAFEVAEHADEYGIQVIIGEEIMTTQGEVIGLFLKERIEPGLGWFETLDRIAAQEGLVYVPHPFDRLHTIPDAATLRDSLDLIDAIETYNSRLSFEAYNKDAARFARKYNLREGAGSDAHVLQSLGTAAVHMPAWDDQESFLTALRQGEIVRNPKNYLYLQGLKRVQTTREKIQRKKAGLPPKRKATS